MQPEQTPPATAGTDAAIPPGSSAPVAAKPEGVPDRFYDPKTGTVDVAGMAKALTDQERSYGELRKHMSQTRNEKKPTTLPNGEPDFQAIADNARATQGGQGSTSPAPEAQPAADPAAAPGGPAAARLSADEVLALGMEDWKKNNGQFSPEFYDTAAKNGFSKDVIDGYVAGKQAQGAAIAARMWSEIHTRAGSKENWDQWTRWATTGLDQQELAVINAGLQGDTTQRALAVDRLKAAYVKEHGTEGQLLSGGQQLPFGAGIEPFQTTQDVVNAMRDPKYSAKDGDRYRQEVANRIAASHRAGIDLNLRIIHNGQRIA
jgi:hypothetical protein